MEAIGGILIAFLAGATGFSLGLTYSFYSISFLFGVFATGFLCSVLFYVAFKSQREIIQRQHRSLEKFEDLIDLQEKEHIQKLLSVVEDFYEDTEVTNWFVQIIGSRTTPIIKIGDSANMVEVDCDLIIKENIIVALERAHWTWKQEKENE